MKVWTLIEALEGHFDEDVLMCLETDEGIELLSVSDITSGNSEEPRILLRRKDGRGTSAERG